jgi:F-type H+-transporting ATPase subunit delta
VGIVERKYAQALYEAALEKRRLDEVRSGVADFIGAQNDVPELRTVLLNPELDSTSKAELLDSLLAGAEPLVRNFLRLLAEKERLDSLEEIARELEDLVAAGEKRLQVTLTTAREISDEEARSLVARIEAEAGRPVEALRRVDPELIGGLVVEAGSRRFDGSVRGRIERLRSQLVR